MVTGRWGWVVVATLVAGAAHAQGAFDAGAAAPPTFEFAQLRSGVQPADVIGSSHGGLFCGGETVLHASAAIEQAADTGGQFAFKTVTREMGVPVLEREVSSFEVDTPGSADFRVGGVLQRLHLDVCTEGASSKGSVELEVKWEVFSAREQRVVLAKTVEGRYRTDDYVRGPLDVRAYVNSLHLFMASDEFKALSAPAAR